MMIMKKDIDGNILTIEPVLEFSQDNHIEENDYWFYDGNGVYHIENKISGKIIFISLAGCLEEFINKFKKEKQKNNLFTN